MLSPLRPLVSSAGYQGVHLTSLNVSDIVATQESQVSARCPDVVLTHPACLQNSANFKMQKALHAKSLQSCPTLCNPGDCSPPGSSVHRILQGITLEWVPFPSPGDLPDPGVEPLSLSPALGRGDLNH